MVVGSPQGSPSQFTFTIFRSATSTYHAYTHNLIVLHNILLLH
jgi:hypothetical protein